MYVNVRNKSFDMLLKLLKDVIWIDTQFRHKIEKFLKISLDLRKNKKNALIHNFLHQIYLNTKIEKISAKK